MSSGEIKSPAQKKKLNPNRDIRRVLNKLAKRNKEKKHDIQINGDDEDSVMIVD